MTVTATSYTPLTYNGNGSTTSFSVTFQFYEITVTHISSASVETVWTENTHYTVTGGEGSTGSITVTTTTPASGESIRIERTTTKSQTRDYDLDNAVLEAALQESDDRVVMIMQEVEYRNSRSPAISIADFSSAIDFPAPAASQALGWNAAGDALVNIALTDLDGVAISAMSTETSADAADLFVFYDTSAGENKAITRTNLLGGIAPQAKQDATTAPTVNEDTADGYSVCSLWGDVTNDKAYILLDSTLGAAVWGKLLLNTIGTSDIDDNSVSLAKMAHGTAGDIIYMGASGAPTYLGKGTAGQIIKQGSNYPEWSDDKPFFHVQDQKANNTDGGTFTSGSWLTRDLNTSVTNEITGASLSSNQITLPAGDYEIEASAMVFDVDQNRIKLRNTTDSTDDILGFCNYSNTTYNGANRAYLSGKITLAGTKTFELQHRCSSTKTINGLGVKCNYSLVELYADVKIWKVG